MPVNGRPVGTAVASSRLKVEIHIARKSTGQLAPAEASTYFNGFPGGCRGDGCATDFSRINANLADKARSRQ